MTKNMIAGMTRFMKMYDVRIYDFVKALRETTYQDIQDEVDRFRGMSRDGAYAAALAEIYERNTISQLQEVG